MLEAFAAFARPDASSGLGGRVFFLFFFFLPFYRGSAGTLQDLILPGTPVALGAELGCPSPMYVWFVEPFEISCTLES